MVMGSQAEQPDTMKGKGSSSSTDKLDYFSRISIDFPSYCWVKGQVLHYRARLLELVRLVATAESQAKWRPRNVLFLPLYHVIPISFYNTIIWQKNYVYDA